MANKRKNMAAEAAAEAKRQREAAAAAVDKIRAEELAKPTHPPAQPEDAGLTRTEDAGTQTTTNEAGENVVKNDKPERDVDVTKNDAGENVVQGDKPEADVKTETLPTGETEIVSHHETREAAEAEAARLNREDFIDYKARGYHHQHVAWAKDNEQSLDETNKAYDDLTPEQRKQYIDAATRDADETDKRREAADAPIVADPERERHSFDVAAVMDAVQRLTDRLARIEAPTWKDLYDPAMAFYDEIRRLDPRTAPAAPQVGATVAQTADAPQTARQVVHTGQYPARMEDMPGIDDLPKM